MKKNQARKFSSRFKAHVVLEALREEESLSRLAEKFDLNRSQISNWKKEFLEKAHLAFETDLGNEEEASSSSVALPIFQNRMKHT